MDQEKAILVTGGAGFIGSHVVRLLVNKYPHYRIINLDALTYAGNLANLKDVEGKSNYVFEKANICDENSVNKIFSDYRVEAVIHLAAESHVDRSISNPTGFFMTNIIGTVNLLNAARSHWDENFSGKCFYHISTDEVYGSLGSEGMFTEHTPYDPRSPYSSSKASSDHIVRSYFHTYQLPVKLSNCSNNYGANQFPEKLIPLLINNIRKELPLPIYGEGLNVRDWLWVEDHARAIDVVFHEGKIGETYNIGGVNEWKNIDLVHLLCDLMDEKLGREKGTARKLITFVKDRAGHDMRYAIDASKIESELDWKPSVQFEQGLSSTIDWYLSNQDWIDDVTSGDYKKYYSNQYRNR